MQLSPATGSKRSIRLDILRGLSILLVIGAHRSSIDCNYLAGFAEGLRRMGTFGVDLFFVLSGFLISGLLFSEYDRHGRIHVGRFLIRRGFKIWPAYLVFITYLTIKIGWARTWPNWLFINNYI